MPVSLAIALVALILAGLAFGLVRAGASLLRDVALRRRRGRPVWEDFRGAFRQSGLSDESLQVIYRFLRECMNREFAIRADDDLRAVYRIGAPGGVPLCDALDEIRVELGLHGPSATPSETEIRTVADIVELLGRATAQRQPSAIDGTGA